MPELSEAVGAGPIYSHTQPVKGMLKRGDLSRTGATNQVRYAAARVWAITLADLLERAGPCVNPVKRGSRGRRAKIGESRAVEELTGAQFQQIRATVNKIGDYLAHEGESREAALRKVGIHHFVWSTSASGADGDWVRFLDLARRASEHKSGLGHKSLDNDIGAARTLLDLAATHGWIARTQQHAENFERIPGEWAGIFEEWRETLLTCWKTNTQTGNTNQAIRELLGACAALQTTPDDAEWGAVLEWLEEHWEENDTPSHVRTYARRAYRDLREEELIDGPELPFGGRERVALVPTSCVCTIAEAYGSDLNGARDGEHWRRPPTDVWDGWMRPARGLVEGTYGLRSFVEYQTIPFARATAFDLPQRARFPRDRLREQTRRSRTAWSAGSIRIYLKRLMLYAGWLKEHKAVDWTQPGQDLRVILDRSHLRAYWGAVMRDGFSTPTQLDGLLILLSRMASPYLEAVALNEGNEEMANQMRDLSLLMDSEQGLGGEGESWRALLEPETNDPVEVVKEQARKVENALTQRGRLGETAYEVLVRIRDVLIADAVRLAGGLDLDEQLRAVRQDERFNREWARRIQEIQLLQDSLVAPLRTRTLRLMDVSMRYPGRGACEGRIHAEYPWWITKSKRNFNPEYLRADDNHRDSSVWRVFDPRVYGLYLMDGGAREILLTCEDGSLWPSQAFFVPDVVNAQASIDVRDARLTTSALSYIRRRMFEAACAQVGLPDWEILRTEGGTANHNMRHAFGTFHAKKGDLYYASKYLQHKDIKTTEMHYSANDESNMGGARRCAAALG